MSEIQVTVNSRTLERVLFVIIIIALLGLNIYQWRSPGKQNEATGAVTQQKAAASQEPATTAAPQATGTCTDSIKNQDETEVDCGGACPGYWYDGKCNANLKPECERDPDCKEGETCTAQKCVASENYCRVSSDCQDPNYECKNKKCVEIPPECGIDNPCSASTDECVNGKCVEKSLSGHLTVNIEEVDVRPGTGNGTMKIKAIKLSIENGERKSMIIYGKAYEYTGMKDPLYKIGKEFDIGTIKSGESTAVYYTVDSMPSFQDDGDARTLRVEIYDDTDEQLDPEGTLTKKFYP